jgi:hypothetical protein
MRDAAEFVTVRDAVAPHTCRGKPLMFRRGKRTITYETCVHEYMQSKWFGQQGVNTLTRGASHSEVSSWHSLLAEERQTGKRKETKRIGKRQNKKGKPLKG